MKIETKPKKRLLITWLILCASLVFFTVVIGGITRLTGSGLSIVEWQPVAGILPPLTEQDWKGLFDQYKESPQYKIQNKGMSLEHFKFIFFWEYLHRIMGRLVGLALLLPLLYFTYQKLLTRSELFNYYLLVALCGLQGFMGWYMVKSGLVDVPMVSHLRLAAHLGLALVILSLIIWHLSSLIFSKNSVKGIENIKIIEIHKLYSFGLFTLLILILQIIWGAFTAGLKAGYFFNTFPLMNGFLVPPDLINSDSLINSINANPMTVQFIHRLLAWLLLIIAFIWSYKAFKTIIPSLLKSLMLFFSISILMQFVIGVLTLLSGVNIALGVIHQAMAAIVVITFTMLLSTLRKIAK